MLVTGASGLLGQWLLATAPPGVSLAALSHRRVVEGVGTLRADLRDPVAVRHLLSTVEPEVVVHAAYAKDRASIVDVTRQVVDAAHEIGAEVVLTSTDAVFHGDGVVRDESAAPDAGWDYGRWKAAAERAVIESGGCGTVVRLPLLVSIDPDDPSSSKIRAAAADGLTTRWYVDEFRRAAPAFEVAEALWRIAVLPSDERSGIWHLPGAERLSRYDIARRVARTIGASEAAVEPDRRPPISTRPRDIAFTGARARATIDWRPTPIGG